MKSSKNKPCAQSVQTEQLLTLPQAAHQLGIPVYAIRRAANAGQIPLHRPFSTRVRVLLSEIREAIKVHSEVGPRDV